MKSKSEEIYLGLGLAPDVGELKGDNNLYGFAQNMRGWGDYITKRNGMESRLSFTAGILGIFDLKIDGDAVSPDKILIVTRNGTFEVIDFAELTSNFFLFDIGINLKMQSPDLTWWITVPEVATGIMITVTSTAPTVTLTSDFEVSNTQYYGFEDATGVWLLSVDEEIGGIQTIRYDTVPSATTYSSDRGFVTGVGVVIQTPNLNRYRITIDDTGSLETTLL